MELLFETRLEIARRAGKLHAVQNRPALHPEPVLKGDTVADRRGVSLYGTVMRDGGTYRMWYQTKGESYVKGNTFDVAYAESEDGIEWKKPGLTQSNTPSAPSNLLDVQLHSPSVYHDPGAPEDARYVMTGWRRGREEFHGPDSGYHRATSADGLHWTLDVSSRIHGSDVITSVYHPGWQRAVTALKRMVFFRSVRRRAIWTVASRSNQWEGTPQQALMPDDFDDLSAVQHGAHVGDYYGMGMFPAGNGMVSFLWRYWSRLGHFSKAHGKPAGLHSFGDIDLGLAYQAGPGEVWMQPSGRPDFLRHQDLPWDASIITTASTPVEVGDCHRLYFSTSPAHGWQQGLSETDLAKAFAGYESLGGLSRIGFMEWKQHRLFGLHSDSEGFLDLNLGPDAAGKVLVLNYQCEPGGYIQAEIEGHPEHSRDQCVPLEGEALAKPVVWLGNKTLPDGSPRSTVVRIRMVRATLWAYNLTSDDAK